MKVKIYNTNAEVVGEQELNPAVFDVPVSEPLVHQAVVTQLANERQVLAHTKDRGEVRGGGRKPWRQKGTGRARAGSSRSPIWIGGGVTFGPRADRNFSKKLNSKMKKKALTMVLSDKTRHGALVVLEKLTAENGKTKAANQAAAALQQVCANPAAEGKKSKRSMLVIDAKRSDEAKRAFSNLADVTLLNVGNINILDLLKHRNVVLTKPALEKIEAIYAKQ